MALTGLVVLLIAGSVASSAAETKQHRARAVGFVASPPSPTSAAAAGPVPAGWLQVVNYYRNIAGLADVTEKDSLSRGDAKHAKWMVKNQSLDHGETPGSPFYTPEGNVAGQTSNLLAGPWGQTARGSIEQWLAAPFHGAGMLDPLLKRSGYADYQEARPAGFPYAAALNVLSERTATPGPATWPVMFPGEGEKVFVNKYPGTEDPDPLESSGCTGFYPPTGHPIYLLLNTNPSVTASSFQQNGTNLDFCIFDETNYSNPIVSDQSRGRTALGERNAIVLIPDNPLESNKTYDVSITSNGIPYSWSFEVGDVVPPTTVIKVPTNGGTYDQDNFRKIKGTATGNPARVDIQLHRDYGGGECKFWTGNKFTAKRACNQPSWVKAKGTDKWSLSVPKLAASDYVVQSRGTDKVGNPEGYTGQNLFGFSLSP